MSTVAMPDLAVVSSPWTLGPLTLRNRVVMGSMHTGLEVHDDGGAGMAAFYRERAEGGAALIVTGGIAVSDEARGGPDFAVGTAKGGWKCLGYATQGPAQYYQYHYNVGHTHDGKPLAPTQIEVAAVGDLDGDGETSSFSCVSELGTTPKMCTSLTINDENK